MLSTLVMQWPSWENVRVSKETLDKKDNQPHVKSASEPQRETESETLNCSRMLNPTWYVLRYHNWYVSVERMEKFEMRRILSNLGIGGGMKPVFDILKKWIISAGLVEVYSIILGLGQGLTHAEKLTS